MPVFMIRCSTTTRERAIARTRKKTFDLLGQQRDGAVLDRRHHAPLEGRLQRLRPAPGEGHRVPRQAYEVRTRCVHGVCGVMYCRSFPRTREPICCSRCLPLVPAQAGTQTLRFRSSPRKPGPIRRVREASRSMRARMGATSVLSSPAKAGDPVLRSFKAVHWASTGVTGSPLSRGRQRRIIRLTPTTPPAMSAQAIPS
jgi:hypothetical protein